MILFAGLFLGTAPAGVVSMGLSLPGEVHFSDVTATAGIEFVHHDPDFPLPDNSWWVGTGAAAADYDLDGDTDIYVVDAYGYPNRLFRNDGGVFTEVGAESGVADTGAGHMGLFTDLDNDGDVDLILANNTQGQLGLTPSKIFRNEGDGSFSDVTAGSGFEPQGMTVGGMTVTDFNEDGLLDIYIDYWAVEGGTPFNYLYRNDGDMTFVDVTAAAGLRADSTQLTTWTPVFVDLNGDMMQDLFAAVDFSENYLFVHKGPGVQSFADRSAQADIRNEGNDMGVAVGDCNGDGLVDLYTTNITPEPPDELEETNMLYMNHGLPNAFTQEAIPRGVWQTYWGWGTAFVDVDLDADLDLVAVGGRTDNDYYSNRPLRMFINDGTGNFEERAAEYGADVAGDARCLLPVDFDGDGDQDLLIVNVLSPAVLLKNETAHANHGLRLRLVGATRSRDAIGAKVKLTAGGVSQVREVMAGGSFFASPSLDLYFGLGDEPLIDDIVVDWPGGAQSTIPNVPADQLLILTEGTLPVPSLSGLTISGPSGTYEKREVSLSATAEYMYEWPADVTATAEWSVVSGLEFAGFASPGVLSVGEVTFESPITIQARMGEKVALHTLTAYDLGTEDVTAPTVQIVEPTGDGVYETQAETMVLSGTASDNLSVQSVTWASDSSGAGACQGAASWMTSAIALEPGANTITIRAGDAAGNFGTAEMVVTRLVPVDVPGPDDNVSSGNTNEEFPANSNGADDQDNVNESGDEPSVENQNQTSAEPPMTEEIRNVGTVAEPAPGVSRETGASPTPLCGAIGVVGLGWLVLAWAGLAAWRRSSQ